MKLLQFMNIQDSQSINVVEFFIQFTKIHEEAENLCCFSVQAFTIINNNIRCQSVSLSKKKKKKKYSVRIQGNAEIMSF